jgi:hypothetical protein
LSAVRVRRRAPFDMNLARGSGAGDSHAIVDLIDWVEIRANAYLRPRPPELTGRRQGGRPRPVFAARR